MSDESHAPKEEEGEARQRWAREAQEALDRTADALKTAWDASRESRMSALEAAKRAARELGDAVERGVDAARERWEAEQREGENVEIGTDEAGSGVDVEGSGPNQEDESSTGGGGPPPTTPPPPKS